MNLTNNDSKITADTEFSWTAVHSTQKNKLIKQLESIIEFKYGNEGVEPLEMHNLKHARYVASTYKRLAEGIYKIDSNLITEKQINMGEIYAIGHDIYMESKKIEVNTFKERLRVRGFEEQLKYPLDVIETQQGNELNSAKFLYKILNSDQFPNLIPNIDEIFSHISVTLPEFDSKKGVRVWQPYITEDSTVSELILGMSDLMSNAGTLEFNEFNENGCNEYKELHVGICEYIKNTPVSKIPIEKRTLIAQSILKWSSNQPSFIAWQRTYFNGYLDGAAKDIGNSESIVIQKNKAINNSSKVSEIKAFLNEEFRNFTINELKAEKSFIKLAKDALKLSYLSVQELYSYLQHSLDNSNEINSRLNNTLSDDKKFIRVLNNVNISNL